MAVPVCVLLSTVCILGRCIPARLLTSAHESEGQQIGLVLPSPQLEPGKSGVRPKQQPVLKPLTAISTWRIPILPTSSLHQTSTPLLPHFCLPIIFGVFCFPFPNE